ncbi:MAG: peptidyl-prolyl cis-trans isomerase [Candidatus Sumerlaeaceae bacterium]
MLRQLRSAHKIRKVIWIGLLLIVIPSFVAFYGWSDYSTTAGSQPMTAAKLKFGFLDSEEIHQPDMQRAEQMLRAQYMNYSRNQNMTLEPAAIDKLAGSREILDQAINVEILRHYAKEHGIVVEPQDAVDELAKAYPPDRRAMVEQELKRQGMTFGQFLEQIQNGMLLQRVRDTLTAQTRVTHYEAWLDYLLKNERLLVDFVRFDAADYTTSVTVDEKELQDYFAKNIKKYHVREQVKYSYLIVRKDDLKSSLTLTEDEVTSYYQSNQEEFRLPRTADIRQIMIKKPGREAGSTAEELTSATEAARAKASDIYQRIVKGEDFATLADQYNEETRVPPREDSDTTATDRMTTAGGFLGTVSEVRMKTFYGEDWTSAVFNLKPGAISQPVDSPRGFFVLKLESLKEGLVQPLDVVKSEVEDKVRTEKVEPVFEDVGNQLRDVAEKGATLQQLAQETSRTVEFTPKVDKRAEFIPGVGLLGEFKEAVQDLQKGGRSEVMSDQARHLVMEVQEEFPDHDPPLDEVREQVVQGYKESKARELAKAAAESVKVKATSVEALKQAVVDAGSTVSRTRPFTRPEAPTVLGPVQNFTEIAGGLRKGAISLSPLGSEDAAQGYIVWHLAEVTEPSKAEFAKQLAKISQDLLAHKREILLLEFLRDRRKQLKDDIEISKAYR